MIPHPVRIKIIDRARPGHAWKRQLPESGSFSGRCEFVMERDAVEYDWLVVVDDVTRHLSSPPETIHCANEHTLLVTTEPYSITRYSPYFCRQFAHVLTSQPPEFIDHPGHIHSQTGNIWYDHRGYNYLIKHDLPDKPLAFSTVCSTKQQRHTMHRKRYQFCQWLAHEIPEMAFFGMGHQPIQHKHEALEPYRCHLVIENHCGKHHWTEKLADAYLSGCLPIYQGCTNLNEYFPEDSFVLIDINKRQEALGIIREIISDPDFYERCKAAIREARRRVLEEHNLPAMLERIVLEHHNPSLGSSNGQLYGRRQLRFRHPLDGLKHVGWHMLRNFR